MRSRNSRLPSRAPSLSFVLLLLLMGVLWIAGGSVRADVAGQGLCRGAACAALIAVALFADRPSFSAHRPVALLLMAVIALPLLQLVPLPPAVWQALPGRAVLVDAARLSGQPQPWRPLSMVPDTTLNALFSLVVPAAVLILLSGIRPDERSRLPIILLVAVTCAMTIGLIQLSGTRFAQPLINYTQDVSGTFANRNHFAAFLALGCLLVPIWFRAGRGDLRWRGAAGVGLLILFALTILASGSRTGMAIGVACLVIGPLLIREDLHRMQRTAPHWLLPTLAGSVILLIAVPVALSFTFDRAISINRALSSDVGGDMRARSLPTVLDMTRAHFPAGTGLGSFDPIFRIYEPFDLLNNTYFNQAHDDLLGLILAGGLPALLLFIVAMAWWCRAGIRAWRGTDAAALRGRLGAAMLLALFVASITDYPLRTPLMMATATIAAALLAWVRTPPEQVSLPASGFKI